MQETKHAVLTIPAEPNNSQPQRVDPDQFHHPCLCPLHKKDRFLLDIIILIKNITQKYFNISLVELTISVNSTESMFHQESQKALTYSLKHTKEVVVKSQLLTLDATLTQANNSFSGVNGNYSLLL